MPLSTKETREIVLKFLQESNNNIPLDIMVYPNQEDLYGPKASRERCGFKIEGGYHPERGRVAIIASNLDHKASANRLLRHEIFGHYGLNTFKPDEKRTFLTQILEAQKEPTLKKQWQQVKKSYSDRPLLYQAEEVFAFIAEEKRSPLQQQWDSLQAKHHHYKRQKGQSNRAITLPEIRIIAQQIAEGIQKGERQQQTFPATDHDQFRQKTTKKPKPPSKNNTQYLNHQLKNKFLTKVRARRSLQKERTRSLSR